MPIIETPTPAAMAGRLILAVLGTGAIVALLIGVEQSGAEALQLVLTAASVAITILLSGILGSVRPVSRPTTAVAEIVAGLTQHPVARWVLSDRAVQVAIAILVGCAVGLASAGLESWLFPDGADDPWRALIALVLVVFPMWLLAGLLLPREPAEWVRQVGGGLRQLLRLPEAAGEPSTLGRALTQATLRTLSVVVARSISIVLLGWILSSPWLLAAFSLALVFLLVGGEVIGQIGRAINGWRTPAAHVTGAAGTESTREEEKNS